MTWPHAHNPGSWETEAEGSRATQQVPRQRELHNETQFHENQGRLGDSSVRKAQALEG